MAADTTRTWLELDSAALRANITALRGLRASAAVRLCCVLKANAYGHGLRELVPQVAPLADLIAVDSLDEARQVRELAADSAILLLGYTPRSRLPEAVALDLELTLYDLESLEAANTAAREQDRRLHVHLKIETGTGRQGLSPDALPAFLARFAASEHLCLAGLSTHFADLEDQPESPFASEQFQRLRAALEQAQRAGHMPRAVHCACSAALLLRPDVHANMVRLGIALYGVWPSQAIEAAARARYPDLSLRPVLSWKTRIAQLKRCPAGSSVGYGRACRLARDTRVAVLPVGYADGYDRRFSGTAQVLIAGQACPVLGRVCMNMTMVDVSGLAEVETEQEVVLLGQGQVSAATLADWAGTIPYEILARLSPLLPRLVRP